MFRTPYVIIRLALDIFKKRIHKLHLLKMRFHFLHNIVTTSAVLFCTVNKFLNGLKDKKIKCMIVEIRGRRCQRVLWDSQLVFSMVCWRLYSVLLEQCIQEIINHCDKLHDYETYYHSDY